MFFTFIGKFTIVHMAAFVTIIFVALGTWVGFLFGALLSFTSTLHPPDPIPIIICCGAGILAGWFTLIGVSLSVNRNLQGTVTEIIGKAAKIGTLCGVVAGVLTSLLLLIIIVNMAEGLGSLKVTTALVIFIGGILLVTILGTVVGVMIGIIKADGTPLLELKDLIGISFPHYHKWHGCIYLRCKKSNHKLDEDCCCKQCGTEVHTYGRYLVYEQCGYEGALEEEIIVCCQCGYEASRSGTGAEMIGSAYFSRELPKAYLKRRRPSSSKVRADK